MCAINCAFKFCNHFSYVKCYRCALYILICFYLCIGLTRIYCIKWFIFIPPPSCSLNFLFCKALGIELFKLNIMYVYDTGICRICSLIINLHCIAHILEVKIMWMNCVKYLYCFFSLLILL